MDPKKTALVLIEYQNDFTSEGGTLHGAVKGVMDKSNMLANTVETVTKAREAGCTIVHAPITFKEGYKELSDEPYGILKGVVDSKSFIQGSWGAAIVDVLKPQPGDIIIEGKRGLCGFASTNLDFILRSRGIETMALGGFLTNCCVESTMRTGYEKGYRVITLKDCTAATSDEEQKLATEKNYPMFSRPMNHDEFLGELGGQQPRCRGGRQGIREQEHPIEDDAMAHIAFLGTGLLGGAFAEAAARRGDSVTAWNRSPDKVLALAPFGVKPAATPGEAVRGAARVHLVLRDDAVVDAVIADARVGLSPGTIVIDHTTTLPTLTAERARRLQAEGVKYLHCPVFMGPAAARKAQGSMMVAGPRALFEEVKADLSPMTGRLEYLGERPDIAAANKLFGNAMIIGITAVTADILTMAQASGVAPEDAISLLGLLDLNAIVAGRGANMARGNFAASFELTMARKDVRLMQETAGDRPLAALPAIAARMDQLIAAGFGAKDAGVLAIDAVRSE